MGRKERSLKSILAEHRKYRRQCQVRIKPTLQLTVLATFLAGALMWSKKMGWIGASLLVGIPLILTLMEIISFFKHDRSIKGHSSEHDL